MINSSFLNIPLIQDQDVMILKNPLPVDDDFRFNEGEKTKSDLIAEQK